MTRLPNASRELRETTLGAIARKDGHGFVDGPFGSALPASEYTPSGIPVIRGSNLSLGIERFQAGKYVFVSEATAIRLKRSICRPGDIIFTKKGTIGQTGIVPSTEPHKTFLLSSNQMKLSVDLELADPLFVYYYVSSPQSRGKIIREAGITGVPKTNLEYLRKFPIVLPSLLDQRCIASVLSAYDTLIENNTRRIEILEEIAQAIYREWFVNFRFPGYEKVEMVESELGPIPEGWAIRRVKDILKRLKAGNTYKEADVAEHGQVPVIDQSRNDFLGFHNNAPDHKASPKDPIVIFGDHTCKMQLMVEPFSVGPNVVPFVSPDETPILFLYFLVDELVETQEYKRHWTELTSKRVVLPPISVANRFSSFTTPIFEHIRLLIRKNLNLRRTRELLLPKLMSGEASVGNANEEVSG